MADNEGLGQILLYTTPLVTLLRPEVDDLKVRVHALETQEFPFVRLSTIAAKGDLIVGTAAGTVANLAVGANTYVLVADSTQATGLKWADPLLAGGPITGVASTHTSMTPALYNSHIGIGLATDANNQTIIAYGYNFSGSPIFQVAAKPFTATPAAAWNPTSTIRLTVMADGSVGIGSVSPDGLQINVAVSDTARGVDNIRLGVSAGGVPRITLEDAGSTQWQVDNTAGTFRILTPGAVKLSLDTSGNLTVTGTYISPVMNNATLGGTTGLALTNFYLSSVSADPLINLDSNDYILYSRSSDRLDFYIASGVKLQIGSSSVAVTGNLTVTGTYPGSGDVAAHAALTTTHGVTGAIVGTGGAQTFTAVKTFSAAPVIGTITNTGTLTLPTATDTLVGRNTTDTFTNKTLTSPAMTNATLGGTTGLGLSNFYVSASGADPLINLDSNDFILYSRSSDRLDFYIASGMKLQVGSSAVAVIGNLTATGDASISNDLAIGGNGTVTGDFDVSGNLGTGWIAVTSFGAGFSSAASPRELKYRRIGDLVFLSGEMAISGAIGAVATAFTLPSGYRSPRLIICIAASGSSSLTYVAQVNTGGDFKFQSSIPAGSSNRSVDGISWFTS